MKNKDSLDEIILNKEQTKFFNLGKKQGELNSHKKASVLVKKEIKNIKKDLSVLKRELTRTIKDRDYWKRKVGWVEKREIKLEKKILKLRYGVKEVQDE